MKKLNVLFCAAALMMGVAGVANAAPGTLVIPAVPANNQVIPAIPANNQVIPAIPANNQVIPAVPVLTPAQKAYTADMMKRLNRMVAVNPQLAVEQLKNDVQHFPLNAKVDPNMCTELAKQIGIAIVQGNDKLIADYKMPVEGVFPKIKLGAFMATAGAAQASIGVAYGTGCTSAIQTSMMGAQSAVSMAAAAL